MGKINTSKIIAIVGPTASGKSNLAIKIAKKIGGEIISADSRQVYKGLDIGTGKVSKKEQSKVRHYMLDIAPPKKIFTADDFLKLGRKAISQIQSRGKIPIIVGGTGFYIDVLLGRMKTVEVPPNPKLRAKLEKLSAEQLFSELSVLDPVRAARIDKYNPRRLIRAIEIASSPKKPVQDNIFNYDVLWLGLKPENIDARIKARLKKRISQGMINEVRGLLKKDVGHKRLEDLGLEYRYVSRHLRGIISRDELFNQLFSEIKKYSKRQMTWFKRNKEINWVSNPKKIESLTLKFIQS